MDRVVRGICSDYTHDGKGVVKVNGIPIFVENLLIGEEAEILITQREKGYSLGRRLQLITVSSKRITPICPNYKECGGCNIQHMTYDEQLRFKQNRVQEVLKRIGGVELVVPPVIGMKNPFKYRNKVQVPFGTTMDGSIISGFYMKASHQIIDMEKCYIEDEDADAVILSCKEIFQKYDIETCDIMNNLGIIRYVVVRKSFFNQDLMVVIVTKNEFFPKKDRVVNELLQRHPKIKTIVQNINGMRSSVVLGAQEKVLFGPGYIEDKICGLTFKVSPKSFFQVNPIQTEVLYNTAIKFANLSGNEVVLDAYCGVGTIGMIASKHAKEVVGVEIVKEAIIDANNNAKINDIRNATFIHEDATTYMFKMLKAKQNFDLVFVDPPRDGCDNKFIAALMTLAPKNVVYISCEPSSLARDLKVLKEKYNVTKVQCVDMFPQTYHVETVVLLELKHV